MHFPSFGIRTLGLLTYFSQIADRKKEGKQRTSSFIIWFTELFFSEVDILV